MRIQLTRRSSRTPIGYEPGLDALTLDILETRTYSPIHHSTPLLYEPATMSDGFATLARIPVLQGTTNYSDWAMEVESSAQLGKFWRAIMGNNSPFDASAAAADSAANREEAALGLIKKTVIKTIALELREFQDPADTAKSIKDGTAKQLWDYLEIKYSKKEGITSFYEFGALFRCNLVDDGTLEQQINKMSDMRSICTMNDFEFKDWQFATLILHALPPSYRHIPDNILASTKIKDIKFADICAKILEAESLRKGDMTTSANLLASDKRRNKGKIDKSAPPPSPCKHCQGNHWNHQCKKKPKKPSSSTQPNAAGASKPDKQKPGPSLHVLDTSDCESDAPVSCYIGLTTSIESWLMDSGATDHMTPYGSDFAEYATLSNSNNWVILGDGSTKLEILGKGSIHRWINITPGKHRELHLTNVLHVRGLKRRFLSTSRFTNSGFTVAFTGNTVAITKGKFRISGVQSGPLFTCSLYTGNPSIGPSLNAAVTALPIELWHQRMGHVNWEAIKRVRSEDNPLNGIRLDSSEPPKRACEGCLAGKAKRKAFKTSTSDRIYDPLEIIHADLQGPMAVNAIGGYRYSCVFTCGGTRYVWVYYLKSKDQTLHTFKTFVTWIEKLTGHSIRKFRSDRGGEFTSTAFSEFLAECGITQETSAPRTPQQNGLAERMNQTILGGAKSMRIHAGLSEGFWAEAMMTASHVLNRTPRKGLNWRTPHELLFGRIPDIRYLRVFGCRAWVHIPKDQRTKWKPNSIPMIFVGYEPGSKAYRLWDPASRSIKVSATVRFDESELPCKPKPKPLVQPRPVTLPAKAPSTHVTIDYWNEDPLLPSSPSPPSPSCSSTPEVISSTSAQPPTSSPVHNPSTPSIPIQPEPVPDTPRDTQETRRSTRVSKPVTWYEGGSPKLWNIQREGETKDEALDRAYQEYIELSTISLVPDEPNTYEKAVAADDATLWLDAMETEIKAMEDLDVWEAVPRPADTNIVSCKWIYKIKHNAHGEISRYRARLVARGFTQIHGTDYLDTYAPVTRLETIRLLFALAVEKDWEIRQIDVKTAYLYGDLDEAIYMEPPKGYDIPDGCVLLLKKALYGLKQAGRQWYKRLREVVSKFDLHPLANDPHTYVAHKTIDGIKRTLILPVYVDDLIPIGDKVLCDDFEQWLPDYFDVTPASDAILILGIRITRNRNADPPFLILDQEKFAKTIASRISGPAKRATTPMSSQEKLTRSDGQAGRKSIATYQSIIGSLMYLMLGTRPDLAYAVGKLSRFSSNPSEEHIHALVRTVNYLSSTADLCLKFVRRDYGNAIDPTGFTDSDWAADHSDSRSTAGYIFLLGTAAFSWYSKKQGHVSTSTADAEYTALFRGGEQAFWLRQLYHQIGLPLQAPLKLYCDSESAIAIAKNEGAHSKSKAIRIETHAVRERINRREIEVEYVNTKGNIADIFTKSLPHESFTTHRDGLGLDSFATLFAPQDEELSLSTLYDDTHSS